MIVSGNDSNIDQVLKEVNRVVVGKEETIKKCMAAILMKGHILIEDMPGVGKTTMAMAFAKAMDLHASRMQFTPDVLPSDITGYYMYNQASGTFKYLAGPVMTELFLADEINRTSPKTQSALLEVMEERRVTIEGYVHEVPKPFIVIATQNPAGSAGTQPLPDSQVDRFMICLHMGYPEPVDEIKVLKSRTDENPLDQVRSVMSKKELLALQDTVSKVYVKDEIYDYIVKLINQTRNHDLIRMGVSPRGSIALLRMAQGMAFMSGRDYVIPRDVRDVFMEVCGHRIFLNAKARLAGSDKERILSDILNHTKEPRLF